jgi:hypothetical protein
VNGDPINGNDPFGLCTIEYTALLTGPSAQCNTAAATAWGTPINGNDQSAGGIDTFSTFAGTGLSQGIAITQVDLAAWGETVYAQGVNQDFWTGVLSSMSVNSKNYGIPGSTVVTDIVAMSGGVLGQVPASNPFFGGMPYLVGLLLSQPPQPFVGGSLVPPFAPNPTQPTCEKGYHPDPTGGVGNYQCVANPGPPPPTSPTPPIAILPPTRILPPPRPIGTPLPD